MTLSEKRLRQQVLLDEIPYPENEYIIICDNDAEFVYIDPMTSEGVCRGCGDTYTTEVRIRNYE